MIDLEKNLNEAQYEAVTTLYGPLLVIAGAGSGKTRTIVYKLAHLVDLKVNPASILLLTFTKKAAQEMLLRAGQLIGSKIEGVSGGTFHSFANTILRRFANELGYSREFTILDQGDSEDIIKQIRDSKKIREKDKSFPKKNTIFALISRMRNKEIELDEAISMTSPHLLIYLDDIENIYKEYTKFKKEHNLMDYDDLLYNLEELLMIRKDVLDFLRIKYQFIMVDEYQDTNLVQGRIISLLGGTDGNVMAVGDDAQSIYSFRGATVRNILDFKKYFPNTKIIKLEQNYRSIQPILDFSNEILKNAEEKYEKKLFATKKRGAKPQIVYTLSDKSQGALVVDKIVELSDYYPLSEIAVLFRAGYQSYPVELNLNKRGIKYKKFGGMKFHEAAHIKDVMAYLKLIHNPADILAWQRVFGVIPKIGPKTISKMYESFFSDRKYILSLTAQNDEVKEIIELIDDANIKKLSPVNIIDEVLKIYEPYFKEIYHDDYPKRQMGLEELSQIAAGYRDLDAFLSDITLESTENFYANDPLEQYVTLSTIHSAKGLEWSVVMIIDMVEDRFPSRMSQNEPEGLEEERRLFYVACTRAKERLIIFSPKTLTTKYGDPYPTRPSPFIEELSPSVYEEFHENYTGTIQKVKGEKKKENSTGKWCNHKIFGKGKILGEMGPDKLKVYFSGFGVKIMLREYLEIE